MLNSSPKPSDSSANSSAERARLASVVAEMRRRVEVKTETLRAFIPRISPQYIAPDHLAPVLALFERIAAGEKVRACVSIPPQHGKTETVLHALAWLLSRRSAWRITYATYQQDQSDDKSHTARDIARRAGVELAADRQNLRMWRTSRGGGCLFTSVDGPATGQGAQVFIVDDPYKGRSEAMSATTRAHVERWFAGTVTMRGQEDMTVLVIHTRWVEDDLIGRIRAGAFGDDWEIVNLPMLADDAGLAAPRPYLTATRVLNPRRVLSDGRTFGWTIDGARRHLNATPEADAEALCQGNPRKRTDGALWSWESIDTGRVKAAPPLRVAVVYLDPNAASEATAANCDDAGIVVLGKGYDNRGYVLADASGEMSVDAWCRTAIRLYRAHGCAYIGVEANLGRRLLQRAIRAALLEEAMAAGREPEHIEVKLISVRGEKSQRSAAARQLYPHVVSHVGAHTRLETSMTSHDYGTSKRSAGDLDALSLGCTDLMLQQSEPQRLASDDYYDGV